MVDARAMLRGQVVWTGVATGKTPKAKVAAARDGLARLRVQRFLVTFMCHPIPS